MTPTPKDKFSQPRNQVRETGPEATPQKPGKLPGELYSYLHTKLFSAELHLGIDDDQKLYGVRVHAITGGSKSRPDVEIFDGPKVDSDPLLASSSRAAKGKDYTIVMLPPLQVSGSDGGSAMTEELMFVDRSHTHSRYRFEIEVGLGKETHREGFEWRYSHSPEIKELDNYSWGWKLVRLSNSLGEGDSSSDVVELRSRRGPGMTSDGLEVVAVWAQSSKVRRSKSFRFRFINTALTGTMGDRFELIAVATALQLWQFSYEKAAMIGKLAAAV